MRVEECEECGTGWAYDRQLKRVGGWVTSFSNLLPQHVTIFDDSKHPFRFKLGGSGTSDVIDARAYVSINARQRNCSDGDGELHKAWARPSFRPKAGRIHKSSRGVAPVSLRKSAFYSKR